MQLHEYVDLATLDSLEVDGFITVRRHEKFPLRILNYSKKAQSIAPSRWSDTLTKCRGLIVDDDNNIVAFGMRKFWNVEKTTWLKKPLTVADKMDGSLGIVYQWDGVPYVATRGSFHSDMADWANQYLDYNPSYREWLFNEPVVSETLTPHVEIIYNDNRIVNDYDYEDLVLLGYNDDVSWTPADPDWTYPGRIAQRFQFDTLKEIFKSDYRPNAEGFVILDSAGQMKKYKYEEYLELHRAIFNMNEKAVYNKLVEGIDVYNSWMLDLPDEFQKEVQKLASDLLDRWDDSYNEFMKVFMDYVHLPSRKDVALAMNEDELPGWQRSGVFSMLDGNNMGVVKIIWDHVKP